MFFERIVSPQIAIAHRSGSEKRDENVEKCKSNLIHEFVSLFIFHIFFTLSIIAETCWIQFSVFWWRTETRNLHHITTRVTTMAIEDRSKSTTFNSSSSYFIQQFSIVFAYRQFCDLTSQTTFVKHSMTTWCTIIIYCMQYFAHIFLRMKSH